ncbi:MAG: hypothetical protein NW215_05610 [Hyphomicrobiales bacterium]|nr:hypothetical protein [Hyphomicrobiales bacterium]
MSNFREREEITKLLNADDKTLFRLLGDPNSLSYYLHPPMFCLATPESVRLQQYVEALNQLMSELGNERGGFWKRKDQFKIQRQKDALLASIRVFSEKYEKALKTEERSKEISRKENEAYAAATEAKGRQEFERLLPKIRRYYT